ncbi:hypothetical protein E3T27_11270 [Cryobacterium lyxosi]|uniref:Uncharacterized protein n=1 Tax=Cryobacterium lyxosi TaxID=1259228 RepID=A0A4V3IP09_9MICO|nr:hypothetical protein E3T27_11270 [Cryobacterium lyxosi]
MKVSEALDVVEAYLMDPPLSDGEPVVSQVPEYFTCAELLSTTVVPAGAVAAEAEATSRGIIAVRGTIAAMTTAAMVARREARGNNIMKPSECSRRDGYVREPDGFRRI